MDQLSSDHEIRVIIRYAGSGPDDSRLIPAVIFKKLFNVFFDGVRAAKDNVALDKGQGEIFVSDLRMGSNIFAFCEKNFPEDSSPLKLFGECTKAVQSSDYEFAISHPAVAKKIVKIGRAYNRAYSINVQFDKVSIIPIDGYFSRRAQSLARMLNSSFAPTKYFSGKAVDCFVGVLSELNSFHETWTAWLKLDGGKKIECVLDKERGEAIYSQYWNRRVSVTGLSRYTGESLLPESFEVIDIQGLAPPEKLVDIRNSISSEGVPDCGFRLTDIQ